ncbi:MAG: hypothetical protein HIU82_14845 [Proteobacteria bacterium]|nr:hypothetical protein [Pseudomonadota bacterium]
MRRPALLGLLCLVLSGCGLQNHLPFVAGPDPYQPAGDSETMQRVEGRVPTVAALHQAPGDVWPGPVQAEPTLESLEQQQLQLPNQATPPALPGAIGSSTPPPDLQPLPVIPPIPQVAGAPAAPPPAPSAAFPVRGGMATPTGGTSAYRTVTLPGGGTGIVVPNGNGTSTIIRSDGSVETVATPK